MSSSPESGPGPGPLVCPRCSRPHPADARICADCRMPLVVAGEPERPARGEAHEEARKIHPRFARGELRRVAVGRNLAEAELIKGMLLEQGIPSMLTRTGGFDVPDFLAAGPRDVLVPEGGVETARGLLSAIEPDAAIEGDGLGAGASAAGSAGPRRRPLELRLLAGVLVALLLFSALAGVVWIYAA